MNWRPMPGDLCKYMSRVLLVTGNPYPADRFHPTELWVETIEIDENMPRRVRCDTLTLIQRAEGNDNDQRV